MHSAQLISTSTNRFAGLLPDKITVNIYTASDPLELAVQEPSDVLYGLFFTACGLSADTRPSSIASFMPRWTPCASTGWHLSISTYTKAHRYIYRGRLSHSLANIQPKLYAVTGELEYRAEDLAVGTSACISNCTRSSRQIWSRPWVLQNVYTGRTSFII